MSSVAIIFIVLSPLIIFICSVFFEEFVDFMKWLLKGYFVCHFGHGRFHETLGSHPRVIHDIFVYGVYGIPGVEGSHTETVYHRICNKCKREWESFPE